MTTKKGVRNTENEITISTRIRVTLRGVKGRFFNLAEPFAPAGLRYAHRKYSVQLVIPKDKTGVVKQMYDSVEFLNKHLLQTRGAYTGKMEQPLRDGEDGILSKRIRLPNSLLVNTSLCEAYGPPSFVNCEALDIDEDTPFDIELELSAGTFKTFKGDTGLIRAEIVRIGFFGGKPYAKPKESIFEIPTGELFAELTRRFCEGEKK